jgi:SAM-dependent methyltransferase
MRFADAPAAAAVCTDSVDVRPAFSSVKDPQADPHINGEYLKSNPTWHVEYSPWKAENIHRFMEKNALDPHTVCEIGCGAGEVLRLLQTKMKRDVRFWGYDVSPQAIELAKPRENEYLSFGVADFGELRTPDFDLLLVLEVVDHVEDYFGFLRMLKPRGKYKLFSFSLDFSVQAMLRGGVLAHRRNFHHHLHHFNKDTAICALRETGYEILDYAYPPPPAIGNGLKKMVQPIRAFSAVLGSDTAARLFGGSLLVLAR